MKTALTSIGAEQALAAEGGAQHTSAEPPEPESACRVRVLCALALVLLGIFSYAGRLSGPFIFDDEQSIVHNPSLVPFDLVRALAPPRESPVAARPLVNLSFALDAALHGLSPTAFHATNLCVHLGCVLLAFAALRRLLIASAAPAWLKQRPELPACLAAGLFCVHPMATEVVLYATQRSEALVALWYLAALWLLAHEAQTGVRSWPWLLVLGALGAASKEVFITAPLVLLACDRAFFAGSVREALRQRPRFHAAAMTCVVPILRLQHDAPRSQSVRLLELDYLLAQAQIVPGYLLHALWPAQPVLDYGPLWPGQYAQGWPWLGLGLPLLAALGMWAWRKPQSGFVALWACAIVAPTSSLLSIHTEIGAERRFYLPLLGVLAALTLLTCGGVARILQLTAAVARPRLAARATLALGVCAISLLAVATRGHALVYRDARSYWQAAIAARPDNARAHYNLAESLRREGAVEQAMLSLRHALELQPDYADAHVNLSGLLLARGALTESLTHAERGVALAPDSPATHYNLALVSALNAQLPRALAELEVTVRLAPQHWEAHQRLLHGYLAIDRADAARAHARALLSHSPDDPLVQRVLAQAP